MNLKMIPFLFCLIISLTLCACSKMYHVNSAPSKRDQCINLKRKQLFVGYNANNSSQWEKQDQTHLLEQEYSQAGCYEIMRQPRQEAAHQPVKK